jgi:hypothetical protein
VTLNTVSFYNPYLFDGAWVVIFPLLVIMCCGASYSRKQKPFFCLLLSTPDGFHYIFFLHFLLFSQVKNHNTHCHLGTKNSSFYYSFHRRKNNQFFPFSHLHTCISYFILSYPTQSSHSWSNIFTVEDVHYMARSWSCSVVGSSN